MELPNKDINEVLQLHEKEIFDELLQARKVLHEGEKPKADSPKPKAIKTTIGHSRLCIGRC